MVAMESAELTSLVGLCIFTEFLFGTVTLMSLEAVACGDSNAVACIFRDGFLL